jgi:hypothetical protein
MIQHTNITELFKRESDHCHQNTKNDQDNLYCFHNYIILELVFRMYKNKKGGDTSQ